MALCRRSSRFIVDAFRRYNSNTAPVRFYGTVRPMGYRSLNPNPRKKKLITLGLLGSGFATSVYFWNLETVPFTKRTHFVLLSTYTEKRISQLIFKLAAEVYGWKILPSHHPQSVRVQKIGQEIIGALLKELKKEEQSTVDLEEFEWEFIVVDNLDNVNAECTPGGKIVVFTGLLDYFKTDAEIAAIIGHEVGHAAARHSAEIMSGILWLTILPDCVEKMTDRFLWLPCCRRHELEADYIGLLLMASAGHDPRVAIKVWREFYRLKPRDDDDEYLSTHPTEKKRVQSLSKVLEEALSLYREALKEKEAEAEGDHPVGHMSFLNRLNSLFFKQR